MAATHRAWRVQRPRVVPGHEVVGEVVGAAPGFAVGDTVGVVWLRGTCGRCRYCARGAENLRPDSTYTGWGADGGYAEYVTVPAGLRASTAAGLLRHRAGAVAVRGHHRLPRAAAHRAAARRLALELGAAVLVP